MSYNVTSFVVLRCDAQWTVGQIRDLRRSFGILFGWDPFENVEIPNLECSNGHRQDTGPWCATCRERIGAWDLELSIYSLSLSARIVANGSAMTALADAMGGEIRILRIWEYGSALDVLRLHGGSCMVHQANIEISDAGTPMEAS